MSTRMRAKFKVTKVESYEGFESLTFNAVCAPKFGPDGHSEDNDFCRWTPSGTLTMSVNNPDLLGVFKVGDKVYLDFTKVEEPTTV